MIDRACISLNNNCNLKCKYCHFKDKQNKINTFSYEEIKCIVDNIHEYCNLYKITKFKLGLVGAGEPMLKKELILKLLEYIVKMNYKELNLYTITNATLLTENLLNQLYKYKDVLKVCISLDGYKEIHNAGRMDFNTVMANIDKYKKIFKTSPPINSTVNLLSYKNKEKLIEFFKLNNLLDVTFSKLVGYFEKDLYISDKQFYEFMMYVKQSGINSRQFRTDKCYDCTMYGKLCGVGRTNIFITPEGIYPCGRFYKMDEYKLGDFDEKIKNIEKSVKKMSPVEDGKCYYIENVEVNL